MKKPSERTLALLPLLLSLLALVPVMLLLVWDVAPRLFAADAHNLLGALPLLAIGVVFVGLQAVRRVSWPEMLRAWILAVAFFFWAANQYWPNSGWATLWNDVAIALFVLDVVLTMVGWPAAQEECTENSAVDAADYLGADCCGD